MGRIIAIGIVLLLVSGCTPRSQESERSISRRFEENMRTMYAGLNSMVDEEMCDAPDMDYARQIIAASKMRKGGL